VAVLGLRAKVGSWRSGTFLPSLRYGKNVAHVETLGETANVSLCPPSMAGVNNKYMLY
jgi:hypothetical protein